MDREALYFDATRPTDFERLARETEFDARLLARAAALRRRLVELKITKYNLARSAPLPQPDRSRLRVPTICLVFGSSTAGGGHAGTNGAASTTSAAGSTASGADLVCGRHRKTQSRLQCVV